VYVCSLLRRYCWLLYIQYSYAVDCVQYCSAGTIGHCTVQYSYAAVCVYNLNVGTAVYCTAIAQRVCIIRGQILLYFVQPS
jgi:hypothetical protein